MSEVRQQLQASRSAALKAKDEFVVRYVEGRPDRTAGIGVSSQGDKWTVKVFVGSQWAATDLPKKFKGLDVEIEVSGSARAF